MVTLKKHINCHVPINFIADYPANATIHTGKGHWCGAHYIDITIKVGDNTCKAKIEKSWEGMSPKSFPIKFNANDDCSKLTLPICSDQYMEVLVFTKFYQIIYFHEGRFPIEHKHRL